MRRLVFLIAAMASAAGAQDANRVPRGTVRASAEAVVTVAPDEARINVGVVTQAAAAAEAAAANARDADAVMKQIRSVLGAKADIKTINYSIAPNYDYSGRKQKITGYTANNTVQARIDNLTDVGKVIDAATQNGANTINGIQFSLRDESAVRAEALRRAASRAKAEAEAIASALGVHVTGVYSAEAGEPAVPRPMYAMMAEARAAPGVATPVQPGNIEVHGVVTVTLEVSQ